MLTISARTYVRQTGGNTRYIRQVVDGLQARGFPLEIVAPRDGFAEASVRNSLTWAAYEGVALQAYAAKRNSRWVWYPADTGPIFRSRGVRTAVTLHGVGALHEPTVRTRGAGRIWLERARKAALAADAIITVSQSSAEDIETLAGVAAARKISVIPHGVAPGWFDSRPITDRAIVTGLGIERPYALYYGNIEPRKNLPLALDAVAQLRNEHPDLELVVSGSPAWGSDAIMDAIRSTSWVRYVGRCDDEQIRALLNDAELFLFPSRYEGFGLPVLEAMATGAAVVCSTRGSLGEVAGDACFTFDDLTTDAVVDACERALRSRGESQRVRARTRAMQFQWSTSYDSHMALFNA